MLLKRLYYLYKNERDDTTFIEPLVIYFSKPTAYYFKENRHSLRFNLNTCADFNSLYLLSDTIITAFCEIQFLFIIYTDFNLSCPAYFKSLWLTNYELPWKRWFTYILNRLIFKRRLLGNINKNIAISEWVRN